MSLISYCGVITDAKLAHSLGFMNILLVCGLIIGNVTFMLADLQKFIKLISRRYGRFSSRKAIVKDVVRKSQEHRAVLVSKKRNLIIPTSSTPSGDLIDDLFISKPLKSKMAINNFDDKNTSSLLQV